MDKRSINENKAIQEGLENFLDLELANLAGQRKDEIEKILSAKEDKQTIEESERAIRQTEYIAPDRNGQVPPRNAQNQNTQERNRQSRNMKNRNVKSRKPHNKRVTNKKNSRKIWIAFALIFLSIAVLWYVTVSNIYKEMNYEKVDSLASEPMKEEGVIHILLIGNDSRQDGQDGRSDAMILVSLSNKTKTIHMTSLLRDMYVEIPGHDANRLNAAYAYGGASLLCETIEHNFGIEVNRYVLVNFQAFAKLVDAVGGVDIEVTNEEVQWINAYLNEYNLLEGREMTTDYLDTSLSGEIHLNGPQALAYSRNRYIGTDFERTRRQRDVLNAVVKKLPIAMATNSNDLIQNVFMNLTTNLTKTEVLSLSTQAGKALSYDIKQIVIPAEGTYSNATIRKMSVLEVDFEENKKIIRTEIYGEKEEY